MEKAENKFSMKKKKYNGNILKAIEKFH